MSKDFIHTLDSQPDTEHQSSGGQVVELAAKLLEQKAEWAQQQNSERLLKAAKDADWAQVVHNQGPPCFHLAGERFCFRAESWGGHETFEGSPLYHEYVSLESLLRSIAPKPV